MADLVSTAQIREELGRFTLSGSVCASTWAKWRKAAGVQGHTCTREQWVRLCACLALYRLGRGVGKIAVDWYIREHGSDPVAYIPGLIPDLAMPLPEWVIGADLPEAIRRWTGFEASERTVRRWVESVGLKYSRAIQYSRHELSLIVGAFVRARHKRRLVGLSNLSRRAA